jgi:protein MpaA
VQAVKAILVALAAGAVFALPAHAVRTSAAPHSFVIGHSSQGRPITATTVGDPKAPVRVLVVGCIHGNEQAGIAIARRLATIAPPKTLALWIVPVLNPDGVAANTRQNGRGIDLNRNFPRQWSDLEGVYDSGPKPLSEPESRAAARLVLRIRPTITIWYHQHLRLVDQSGGSVAIERKYARDVGLPLVQLPRYPGSATLWENHVLRGSTAFVVELAAGALSKRMVERHARAVLAL